MKVQLSSQPNFDYPHDRRGRLQIKPELVEVETIAQASKACREFIENNGLGGGNWVSGAGDVFDGEKLVARISYNGRAWEPGTYPTPEILF